MLEGFEAARITTPGADISLVRGGDGPPLLLLHGYPETHVAWHKAAPLLAQDFHVVVPDLRGYGDSGKPPGGADHSGYSKRSMAADQVEVMTELGFRDFLVAGHDRGGRVAHRMALDHADRVRRVAVLAIVPTRKVFGVVDQAIATGYYHWFFLIQPADFPETLIGSNLDYYLRHTLDAWSADPTAIAPEARAEYRRCLGDPASLHATCEDYRAGASIDLRHDEADRGRKVECPLLALWGSHGLMGDMFDVLAAWRERAADVRGRAIDCGHFLPEEAPDETARELHRFFVE